MKLFLFACFFLVVFSGSFVRGQTVTVGSFTDDGLRQLQLQGKLDLRYSLLARPFFTDASFTTDSIYQLLDDNNLLVTTRKPVFGGKGTIELLPVTFTTRFNSNHPYGWNQPGLLQAKGLQNRISAGVYFTSGILSVQFKPEVVTAGNPEFEHNGLYGAASTGSYQKLFFGQSSIRLNKGAVSLGLSTENLWWGPGMYNSLLMSNNAPGFAHLSFNTRRPLITPIGNFEWQIVMGKLVEDPNVLLENKNLTTTYYNPETYGGEGNSGPYDVKQKWRYLNALTLTYNPKWVKGFFIGLNRVAYTYNDKLQKSNFDFFHKYFPTFFNALRENYAYGTAFDNNPIGYKQIFSVHFRYVFPKAHAEIYSEYGIHDNSYNIRDFTLDPQHAAAYTIGFKKLKELPDNKWLDIAGELTRMSEQVDYTVRTSGNWYLYQGGFTNQNRIIGAGVGSGNNVQTFRITHIDGFKKIGFSFQSIQHDPTAIVGGLYTLGLRTIKWNDISYGLIGQYRYKQFIINGELQMVHSKNYSWEKDKNLSNFYGLINLSYIW